MLRNKPCSLCGLNERSFVLEKFISNLQKAHDELLDCGIEVINGDIVDSSWDKIKSQDIIVCVYTLKVDYQCDPRDYKIILQDIAAEISTEKKASFSDGARNVSPVCTSTGRYPDTGTHTIDGSICISVYESTQ